MTGTKAKSTISNTGDGKTVSGAWPNHDSGRQDERLDGITHQYAASSANRRQEMALKAALGAVTPPEGVSNGECRLNQSPLTITVIICIASANALISRTGRVSPNHCDLLRIFDNPNESQSTDITQLVSGWTLTLTCPGAEMKTNHWFSLVGFSLVLALAMMSLSGTSNAGNCLSISCSKCKQYCNTGLTMYKHECNLRYDDAATIQRCHAMYDQGHSACINYCESGMYVNRPRAAHDYLTETYNFQCQRGDSPIGCLTHGQFTRIPGF